MFTRLPDISIRLSCVKSQYSNSRHCLPTLASPVDWWLSPTLTTKSQKRWLHPQVSSMLVPHVLSVATGEPSNQEVCTKNDRPTSVLTYDIMSVGYRSHLGRLHHHLKSLQFVDDMSSFVHCKPASFLSFFWHSCWVTNQSKIWLDHRSFDIFWCSSDFSHPQQCVDCISSPCWSYKCHM